MSNLILENGTGVNPKLTRKVKRKYEDMYKCKYCGHIHFASTVEIGFVCSECHKYNSISDEYKITMEELMEMTKDTNAPFVIRTGDKLEYTKFRDEMQIRSDLYVKGIRRDTVGPNNFRKILKKELLHEKCYRGQASDVD